MRRCALLLLALVASSAPAADAITVAVASNFSRPAAELAALFTNKTGITVRVSNGSTGKLYAQILHGAPFDAFLAADAERPALLEASGHAVAGSRFTYATGALVLWSRNESDCLEALRAPVGGRVALANPDTAPYGSAAREFLEAEGYWKHVSARAVYGESIAQALQFVATGNAALGLIAKSQLTTPELPAATCTWHVPETSHTSIEQQAVLLSRASSNAAARGFLDFLRSADAGDVLRRYGYGTSQ